MKEVIVMHLRSCPRRLGLVLALSVLALAACTSTDVAATAGPSTGASATPATPPGRILIGRPLSADKVGYFQMATDGSDEAPFAPGSQFEARQLSPDGSTIAVVAMGPAGVIVGGSVGVDGSGFHLFEAQDRSLHLACGVWAPQSRIACEGWDDTDPARAGVYTVLAEDGTEPRRLTEARDVPCDYSPDGTQLAFVRVGEEEGVGDLMVMDAGGGQPRSLAQGIAVAGVSCDWSPDGEVIVAGSTDGSLVMVTPGGELAPFGADPMEGHAAGAVWSPDGTRIMFSMTPEGDDLSAVYIGSRDGSDLLRLTDEGAYEEAALWLS